jgi:hypothetical protein
VQHYCPPIRPHQLLLEPWGKGKRRIRRRERGGVNQAKESRGGNGDGEGRRAGAVGVGGPYFGAVLLLLSRFFFVSDMTCGPCRSAVPNMLASQLPWRGRFGPVSKKKEKKKKLLYSKPMQPEEQLGYPRRSFIFAH